MQLSLPLYGPTPREPGPVVFVRHRRARRYILRVLVDGTVRVTLPRWGVKREAQAFLDASSAWIARQLAGRRDPPRAEPWGDGTGILIGGRTVTLRLERGSDAVRVWCDDVLIGTMPRGRGDVRTFVSAWLMARARRELPPRLQALAAEHGITVPRVSIRDQRSRWGACSPTGTITLNWRLVQTPDHVRDYVLLHELMHRRELNHSRRFWRLVAAACPAHAEARRWLRREGKLLWADGE